MADNSVGIKFEINGGQQVVQGMRDMTTAFKTLEEKIKTNLNGFNNWNASTTVTEQHQENLRAKIEVLNAIIQKNAEKFKETATATGELSKAQLKAALDNEKFGQSLQLAQQELAAIETGLVNYNKQTAESEARTKTLDAELNLHSVALEKNKYDIDALNATKQALINRLHEEESTVKSTESALKAAEQVYAGNVTEIEKYKTAHVEAQTAVSKTRNEIENLNRQLNNLDFAKASDGLQQIANFSQAVGRAFQGASTAAATALETSVDASIGYESAFAGVKKTADDLEVALMALDGELQANGDAWDYNAVKAAASTDTIKNAIASGYATIKEDLLELGAVTASTSEEIMNVAEYAGQLGIPAEQIAAFTKVAIEMGDSTMLSADAAAMAMARLANVLMEDGLSAEETSRWYERLGSVIVELGNNAAATEPEITNVLTRIAAVGKQSNFTTAELAAMATAVVSVGVKYESGGTAIMNTMSGIEKAVGKGGESVKKFADVAGMSAQDFTIAWKTEPMSAMQEFLKGLQQMGSGSIKTAQEIDEAVKASSDGISKELKAVAKIAGMSAEEFAQAWSEDKAAALDKYQEGLEGVNLESEAAVTILSDLGINSKRQVQTILSLAASEQDLEEYIRLANKEWERSVALEVEANKRYATLQSVLIELGNAWRNVASILGDAVAPVIKIVAKALTEVALVLVDMPKPLAGLIAVFLGLTAAIAPAFNAIGMFAMNLNQLMQIAGTTSVFSGLAEKIVAPFVKIPAEIATVGAATETAVGTALGTNVAGAVTKSSGVISKALGTLLTPFKAIGTTIATVLGSSTIAPIIAITAAIVLAIGALAKLGGGADEVKGKIEGFITSATEKFAEFAANLPSILEGAFSAISESAPLIFDTIITALSEGLPMLFESGAQIIIALIESISANLPSLIQSAVSIIQTLAMALVASLPSLIESGAKMIAALIQGIITSLPVIAQASVEIIISLVTGLLDGIASLQEAGMQLAQSVADKINELWAEAMNWATEMVNKLISGISGKIAEIVAKAQEMSSNVKNKINEIWFTALSWATEMVSKLISGIAQKISEIVTKAKEMAEKVRDKIKELWSGQSIFSIGANLIQGLINGINSLASSLIARAKAIADAVKSTISAAFDIGSPSKWGKKIGAFLFQGIEIGYTDEADGSYSSIYNATRDTLKAIDDASARELSKAIDNTRQINATAQNQINTFIDYDRIADIVGERVINLDGRLVGRELRNMGVQF